MTKLNPKIESCGCTVCRSDLAYIVPCAAVKPILTLVKGNKK